MKYESFNISDQGRIWLECAYKGLLKIKTIEKNNVLSNLMIENFQLKTIALAQIAVEILFCFSLKTKKIATESWK
ncbi:hypothetical protein ACFSX9_13300 [Flavobacterium ardleyense]|uniref:Uncharacterized protein n=1 Tax=Flavobacterium ardleyense TaxID=2038737 RepID=A0ABW5ZC93_9FLAO